VGTVSGVVTDSVSGKPLANIRVLFYRPLAFVAAGPLPPAIPQVWTDSLGQYKATLDTGNYLINAQPWLCATNAPQYYPEWFDDAHTPDKATPVQVGENATVSVNFDLIAVVPPKAVTLSGVVRDSAGKPLANAIVGVFRSVQAMQSDAAIGSPNSQDVEGKNIDGIGFVRGIVWGGLTDTLGQYSAKVLAGGSYIVGAVKKAFAPQFYDHKASPDEASVLTPSADSAGINFDLTLLPVVNNTVSGLVKDSAGTGIASRIMLIPLRNQAAALRVRFASTDSTGAYAIATVRAGKYLALAIPYAGYAPAFYKAGALGVIHWNQADTITVAGSVNGIDIGVVPGKSNGLASVHGFIRSTKPLGKTDALAGLAGANVYLQDNTGSIVGFGTTDQNGAYTLTGVPAGNFSLYTEKAGYVSPSNSVNVGGSQYSVSVSDVTIDPVATTSVSTPAADLPATFSLGQNYPNPFNPTTVIRYSLPAQSSVSLVVYNLLGEQVATLAGGVQTAGAHQVTMDGRGLASGVYFYRLTAGSSVETKRMLLIK
jgi:hypothetical protein